MANILDPGTKAEQEQEATQEQAAETPATEEKATEEGAGALAE